MRQTRLVAPHPRVLFPATTTAATALSPSRSAAFRPRSFGLGVGCMLAALLARALGGAVQEAAYKKYTTHNPLDPR